MDRKCFMLLTRHTDAELTDFLQRKAEEGWMLKGNKGNIFTFKRQPYNGRRVCAVSFFSQTPDIPTIKQVRQYLPVVRRTGWDTICIGQPEDIFDSKRHVFLKEEILGAPLPTPDEREMAKAAKRGRKTALRCLATALLIVAFLLFYLTHDFLRLVTSLPHMVSGAAFALLLGTALVLAVKAIAVTQRQKRGKTGSPRDYRWLDRATLWSTVMLAGLLALLLVDSIFAPKGSMGQRVRIGGEEVVLYSDALPLTLEQVGGDVSGPYRISRFLEGGSPLASYYYGFDESLATANTEIVSYISYTVFTSPVAWIREWVAAQQIPLDAREDPETADSWGVETAYVGGNGLSLVLLQGERVVVFQSGFPLAGDVKKAAAETLLS